MSLSALLRKVLRGVHRSTPSYRTMHLYLFDTCVLKCGYCHLAEGGHVLDAAQLRPFRDEAFVRRLADFFNTRTTAAQRWNVLLTGGDPLLMPNLSLFCDRLFAHDNRVSLYTSLHFSLHHSGLQYLLSRRAPEVDYIMASLHPEGESDEAGFFERVRLLKQAGHHVIVRFVGHPRRLDRLDELALRRRALDVCFYPTTLFSKRYPSGYTAAERDRLRAHFGTYSQAVQLHGGLDTAALRCHAGSRTLAASLRTGLITPCITVRGPVLGSIYEDRLDLLPGPITCPEPEGTCSCDVHFQQDIVIGAEDSDRFAAVKQGYIRPLPLVEQDRLVAATGLPLFERPYVGGNLIGQTTAEDVLFYDRAHVQSAHARSYPAKKP